MLKQVLSNPELISMIEKECLCKIDLNLLEKDAEHIKNITIQDSKYILLTKKIK